MAQKLHASYMLKFSHLHYVKNVGHFIRLKCIMIQLCSMKITCLTYSNFVSTLHGQTGFMENRCIIDNVLTFWEAIALAKKTNQHINFLMLEFEKAYGKV